MNDLIKSKLTPAIRAKIDEALALLEDATNECLSALSEEERSRYGSINEQNKLFVNKVRDYYRNSPQMSSPEVDWEEFNVDYEARVFLESRASQVAAVAYRMESTKILHDHDNHQAGLTDYAYAKYKKDAGAPGYTEKVAELKQFFPRTSRKPPGDDEK